MKDFVLDCSVTMAWLFEDESSGYADAVLDALDGGQAIAPGLWLLETANALLVAERRNRIAQRKVDGCLDVLGRLAVKIDDAGPEAVYGPVIGLARKLKLSAYDAAYLELALRLRLPLATLDSNLERAARKMGSPLFIA